MINKLTVFEDRSFTYEGLFRLDEIYKIIEAFLAARDYDKYDQKHIVIEGTQGKIFEIETHFEKEYSDQHSFWFEIDINCSGIKEVTQVLNGEEVTMHSGRFEFNYRGFIKENTSMWHSGDRFGFKVIMNYLGMFFVFRQHLQKFKKDALGDVDVLQELVWDYFNARKHMK
jgi:hypothetical protein